MSSARVSINAEAFSGELLEAALTAYLHRANPSALFGRIAKAAACAASGSTDRETREHLLGFANRCLELQRAEVKAEDEAFGSPVTR